MIDRKKRKAYIVLIAFLTLFTIVSIVPRLFIGMDSDEQYSMALIYRLAKGDIPILEVWDPHQTSAYLPAMVLWLYMKVIGGTDYMCIFLRLLGLIAQTFTAVMWYLGFKDKYNRISVVLCSLVIMNVLPKWIQSPEFTNTALWWGGLLTITLSKYLDTNKKIYEILAGVCVTMLTLAYPSMVIIYVVIILFLILKKRKPLFFVGIPVAAAVGFFAYLLTKVPMKTLIRCINMIRSDETHTQTLIDKMLVYLKEIPALYLEITIIVIIAIITYVIVAIVGNKRPGYKFFLGLLLIYTLVGQLIHWFVIKDVAVFPQIHYLVMFIVGLLVYSHSEINLRRENINLFWVTLIISICSVAAVMLLTNLEIKSAFVHLLPGMLFAIMISSDATELEGISNSYKQCFLGYAFVVFIMVVCFGRLFLVRVDAGVHEDILLVRQKALYTAGKYEYFAYMEGYRYNLNYETLEDTVHKDTKVMYVGIENLIYPSLDVDVCSASVISTPVYNDRYVEYFSINPQKEPEYVLVSKSHMVPMSYEFNEWLKNQNIIYVE